MARYDDLNTKGIAYAAVLSVVILVVILQGTQALCYFMVNSEDARKDMKKSDHAREVKREQLSSLNGVAKVRVLDESAPPPKKGEEPATREAIRISIEEAQKIIIKELGSSKAPGA
jgi:hypothetical protein